MRLVELPPRDRTRYGRGLTLNQLRAGFQERSADGNGEGGGGIQCLARRPSHVSTVAIFVVRLVLGLLDVAAVLVLLLLLVALASAFGGGR